MRRLLGCLGAGLVLMLVAVAVAAVLVWRSTSRDTTGQIDFDRPLRIPELAESTLDAEGRRVFDLTMRKGVSDFGHGDTATLGFDGDYLGPTLRARRGEEVMVRVRNEIGEASSVHWHGMHLPARMDGGPHQPIAAGETWTPTWRIDQRAATLWYHPHLHGTTLSQVYRGLAGMFILDDDDPVQQRLPHTYGVDDLPVIVQDRKLDGDGRLDDSSTFLSPVGAIGDTMLVNGTVAPYQEVTTERIRLRLLNGSHGRIFTFGFDDDRELAMVASDGGLLAAPYRTSRIRLSPGERAEIVVELSAGERTVLRSYPSQEASRFAGGSDTLDLLELRAADTLAASPPVPDVLGDPPRLDAEPVAEVREFDLAGHNINGQRMSMGRVDLTVRLGDTEVWWIRNRDSGQHDFHVHDVQFQVLEYDGAPPPPELAGWKDTVTVPDGSDGVRIALRFTDYADPTWPYMYHCHMLYHEDRGMMGQFLVLEPGQEPGPPPGHDGHEH